MSKELNCRWHFAPSYGGLEQGPNEAMAETFKKVPYDALVRESIQNSLDAVADATKPVVMNFDLKMINSMDYPRFFDLKYHILGCVQKYNNDAARSKFGPMSVYMDRFKAMYFLNVSDSNTKGMEYRAGRTDSTFYSFVKCAGNSVKSSSDSGGSFGFGKAAYFNVSKIRAIFVSTKTKEGKAWFEGVASLCTHCYQNAGNFQPVGFYCDNEQEEPISDEALIPEAFRRSEAGTTVSILGLDTQESTTREIKDEIIRSAIFNFWCAILQKRLVVRVDDGETVLDETNIEELAAKYFPEFDEESKYTTSRNPRPYIDAVLHADRDGKHLVRRTTLPKLGPCVFYVLKRKTGTDMVQYMRSPRMLVYSKKTRSQYGYYGVLVCKNAKGNELLKTIEDPSHREWDYRRLTNKQEQKYAKDALTELKDFINNTLQELFASADVEHVDIKGLENYLYIPTEYDEGNDESDHMSDTGAPTGHLIEEGTSLTTDINGDPVSDKPNADASNAGTIIIKQSATATPDKNGSLRSGHGVQPRKGTKKGVPMPGDRKEGNTASDDGVKGLFATDIEVPYRSFCQTENGQVVHYVVLRSPSSVDRLQLQFFSVGEDGSEEPIVLKSADAGRCEGNTLKDASLLPGSTKIRVQFADSMKHSIKLRTQELVEI